MAIYTRGGAPVEIVARNGSLDGNQPVLVQAKLTGPYPDGSGANNVGELLHATDRVAKGWFLPMQELCSDTGGWAEIVDVILRTPETALNVQERKKIERYYGVA